MTPAPRVAFIGLGIMGLPMARNLRAAGFSVVGHNRSPARATEFAGGGGETSDTIQGAVVGADVVALMLPDSPDVEQVLTGPDGVFGQVRPGTLVIDFSTIHPDVARAMAEEGVRVGVEVLDAPVSGGEPGAVEGSLSIMVGGSDHAFESASDVLNAVGRTIVHVGPAGAGQTVKAANQLIVAGTIELVAESMALLEASGLDVAAALQVLKGGLAGSAVLERKSGAMTRRDYAPGFRLDLHHKDLGIALDVARERGVATPLGALTAQLVAALVAQGKGNRDHSALFALVEELSGRDAD